LDDGVILQAFPAFYNDKWCVPTEGSWGSIRWTRSLLQCEQAEKTLHGSFSRIFLPDKPVLDAEKRLKNTEKIRCGLDRRAFSGLSGCRGVNQICSMVVQVGIKLGRKMIAVGQFGSGFLIQGILAQAAQPDNFISS
jgi:hypothetical protein